MTGAEQGDGCSQQESDRRHAAHGEDPGRDRALDRPALLGAPRPEESDTHDPEGSEDEEGHRPEGEDHPHGTGLRGQPPEEPSDHDDRREEVEPHEDGARDHEASATGASLVGGQGDVGHPPRVPYGVRRPGLHSQAESAKNDLALDQCE